MCFTLCAVFKNNAHTHVAVKNKHLITSHGTQMVHCYTTPLPVVDPERPWGSSDCSTCKGMCFGHYKTKLINVQDKRALQETDKPPSAHLKALFSEVKGNLSEAIIKNTSKTVLLPPEECKLWLTHCLGQ